MWDQPRLKPFFENTTRTRVVGAAGRTVYLHCRVGHLGDRAVSIDGRDGLGQDEEGGEEVEGKGRGKMGFDGGNLPFFFSILINYLERRHQRTTVDVERKGR